MNDLKFTTAQDYMHTSKFDDLMYQAGLTASGSWDQMDEYDQVAVMRFAELIVRECNRYACGTWEHGHLLGRDLLIHFGIEQPQDE